MIYALLALMAALAAVAVWRVAEHVRDYLAIAALTLAIMPLLAMGPTGDMSRYLPARSPMAPKVSARSCWRAR